MISGNEWVEVAGLLWPLLTEVAAEGRTTTSAELASAISADASRVRSPLGAIEYHCLSEGLPPLTAVVLDQDAILIPGVFHRLEDVASYRPWLCEFDWRTIPNPFVHVEYCYIGPRPEEPLEYPSRPSLCPVCGSSRVGEVIRGLVTWSWDLDVKLATGRAILVGCIPDRDGAAWRCSDCDTPFRRTSEEPLHAERPDEASTEQLHEDEEATDAR